MRIWYFIKPSRTILMARIWTGGKSTDKSTGIDTKDDEFDFKIKRFKNSAFLNKRLSEFESDVYESLSTGAPIKKTGTTSSEDVTLSFITQEYRKRLDRNRIYNKKTGKPLSERTKDLMRSILSIMESYSKTDDFNFTSFNISQPKSKHRYDDLVSSLKAHLSHLDNNTTHNYLTHIKSIIKTVCHWHEIEIGYLLDNLKMSFTDKDVIILDQDQHDFIISNYDEILEGCTNLQRQVMQYWYVALSLAPRKADMFNWRDSNLYTDEDGIMWIKYIPQKRQSSGTIIDVPIYDDRVKAIFEENSKRFSGRLLPPISNKTYISTVMKKIAKRYEIFHREVQIFENGQVKKKPMWELIKLHQMRATGASMKVMDGMPESIVKEYTGHTHDSKSWTRYMKVLNSSKAKYAKILASKTSDRLQKEASQT